MGSHLYRDSIRVVKVDSVFMATRLQTQSRQFLHRLGGLIILDGVAVVIQPRLLLFEQRHEILTAGEEAAPLALVQHAQSKVLAVEVSRSFDIGDIQSDVIQPDHIEGARFLGGFSAIRPCKHRHECTEPSDELPSGHLSCFEPSNQVLDVVDHGEYLSSTYTPDRRVQERDSELERRRVHSLPLFFRNERNLPLSSSPVQMSHKASDLALSEAFGTKTSKFLGEPIFLTSLRRG